MHLVHWQALVPPRKPFSPLPSANMKPQTCGPRGIDQSPYYIRGPFTPQIMLESVIPKTFSYVKQSSFS